MAKIKDKKTNNELQNTPQKTKVVKIEQHKPHKRRDIITIAIKKIVDPALSNTHSINLYVFIT